MTRRAAEKPCCQKAVRWLSDPDVATHNSGDAIKGLHGKHVLAPFTGQDYRALAAFAHLVDLYTVSDTEGRRLALEAMRATVLAAQEKTRPLFAEVIPCVFDWSEREKLWMAMGFAPLVWPAGARS